jgi:hypothetical protein
MRDCWDGRFEQLSWGHSGYSDTSQSGPSIYVSGDSIGLIYRGEFEDHLYELGAGEGSSELGNRIRYADSSGFAPANAKSQGTREYIAWTGKDADQSVNFSPSGLMPTF